MKIVTVIPLAKGPLKGDLTYFTAKEVSRGSIVTITLRGKKLLGLVTQTEEATEAKGDIKEMNFNLKKILDVKEESLFIPEFLDAVIATGEYFATSTNNAMAALIPSVLRTEYDKISKWKHGSQKIIQSEDSRLKNEKLLLQMPLSERLSVYKTLIRENFASKKSIFIVLPTEKYVKTFVGYLSKGVENFIYGLHSGLGDKKIFSQIEKIITDPHPVLIIGTAPYLSIPRLDLGAIIVEHESSTHYKMVANPYFDLRTFTEIFASKLSSRFILADTLLRFETIGRVDLDHLAPMHNLSYRLGFEGKVEIMKPQEREARGRTGGKFQVMTEPMLREIDSAIKRNKNVFVFSLRKGLATMTVCRDCNHTVVCKSCGAPVVLYLSESGKKRMLICNKCKTEMKEDTLCQSCGSWNLMPLGIGTETVEEFLKEALPEIKIFRLDKEIAKTNKEAEKVISKFEESTGNILIGTEMALPFLTKEVPLSLIASFDSFWSIPNFKISERVIQLIISLTEKTEEKLIIQTKNDRDEALLAIERENLLPFVRSQLEEREELSYPPYHRFIKVTFVGDKAETTKVREFLKTYFGEYSPEIFSGFMGRQKGYATNALIKMDLKKWSLPELSARSSINKELYKKLLALPPEFQIFVDPEDLL